MHAATGFALTPPPMTCARPCRRSSPPLTITNTCYHQRACCGPTLAFAAAAAWTLPYHRGVVWFSSVLPVAWCLPVFPHTYLYNLPSFPIVVYRFFLLRSSAAWFFCLFYYQEHPQITYTWPGFRCVWFPHHHLPFTLPGSTHLQR